MPRGHHQFSQSRVYQDTKNTIRRCMDLNASLSNVFPDYLPRPSSPSPINTWPSFYFIHPLHSPYFPPSYSSFFTSLNSTLPLLYPLPSFPSHLLLALPYPVQLPSLSSHYLLFFRPPALSIPVIFLFLFAQLLLLLTALLVCLNLKVT